MPFDAHKFGVATFSARTARVSVPALADFFGEGEKPEFVVRMLTADELAVAEEAVETNRAQAEVVRGLAGGATEKAAAVLRELGITTDLRNATVRGIEMVLAGTVEPALDRETVVKIANFFPIEFKMLYIEISRLTGAGAVLGESNGSGATTPCDSP